MLVRFVINLMALFIRFYIDCPGVRNLVIVFLFEIRFCFFEFFLKFIRTHYIHGGTQIVRECSAVFFKSGCFFHFCFECVSDLMHQTFKSGFIILDLFHICEQKFVGYALCRFIILQLHLIEVVGGPIDIIQIKIGRCKRKVE